MSVRQCCEIKTRVGENARRPASRLRRGREIANWIIPGTALALLPKCPVCLAAYVAAWTGIGLSLSVATHLRASILGLSVGLILFLAARNAHRLIHKFAQHEKVIGRAHYVKR
jgi:hypothetical protein